MTRRDLQVLREYGITPDPNLFEIEVDEREEDVDEFDAHRHAEWQAMGLAAKP